MSAGLRSTPVAPLPWGVELAAATGIAWALLLAIPIGLGGIGLSWDALNHHIYLGWVANSSRFDRDFLAASYQAYQYPYLFWPAYKLAAAGVSGEVAGAVLVSLHVLAVPALWAIARVCVPDAGWYGSAMRTGAILLGISAEVFLSLLDTTSNDGLAAVPFVWAVAFALLAASDEARPGWLTAPRSMALSGLAAGLSVACKLSNGPLAVLLPLLWVCCGASWRTRIAQVVRGSAWTLAGFALSYGWWGWQLWRHFGNPIYPFDPGPLAPFFALLGPGA